MWLPYLHGSSRETFTYRQILGFRSSAIKIKQVNKRTRGISTEEYLELI